MALTAWNVEWLNSNSVRSYPLSETADKKDLSGVITLPDSLLLELQLVIHAGLDINPEKVFLRSLAIFSAGIAIVLGYDDGTDTPPPVASAVVVNSAHQEFNAYGLTGVGDFYDALGHITVGDLTETMLLPPAQYTFSPASGQLDPDCVRPILRGVSSIALVNGDDVGLPLYGDIEIVAGSNSRLEGAQIDANNARVVINAIQGEGLNVGCECDTVEGVAITTISGVRPTAAGDLAVVGNKCINIVPITNGIRIEDICADPCCGCEELKTVTNTLEIFGSARQTLQEMADRLQNSVDQMSTIVLGSKLNDMGCSDCP